MCKMMGSYTPVYTNLLTDSTSSGHRGVASLMPHNGALKVQIACSPVASPTQPHPFCHIPTSLLKPVSHLPDFSKEASAHRLL